MTSRPSRRREASSDFLSFFLFFLFFFFAKCETKAGVSGSGLTGGGTQHLVQAVVTPPPLPDDPSTRPPPVCVFLFSRSHSVSLSHTLCVFFPLSFVFLLRMSETERERSSACNRLLAHRLPVPYRSPYRSPYRFHGRAGLFLIIYNILQWKTRFCLTGDEDDARVGLKAGRSSETPCSSEGKNTHTRARARSSMFTVRPR